MRRRLALVAALAAGLALLPASSAGAANLYLANYGGPPEGVNGFARALDGTLSPLPGSPFPVPNPPGGLWALGFTPEGGRAVAAYLFDGGLRGLTVAADGSIAPSGDPISAPSITGLAVSPDGRFAYAPTRTFAMEPPAVGILGYSIGANASLTELGSSPFGSGQVGDVAMTPDGRFLFALAAGGIERFSVAGDGALTDLGATTPAPGANSLFPSPDGRFLFAGLTSGMSDGVQSFAVGPDGSLTANGPAALTGSTGMGYPGVAPDGGAIYMPDGNLDGIVTAVVDADGRPSVVGTTPVTNPESVAVSPDGRFLYYTRGGPLLGVATIGADRMPTLRPEEVVWQSGEPQRILFGPSPAPTARVTAAAGAPGTATRFDASGSERGVRFDWDFGDGTRLADGGAAPTHTYASAGVYPVRLTVTDAQGCSTQQVYSGQSTSCPGSPLAASTISVDTPPSLQGLTVTNRRFAAPAARRRVKRGTAFRYRLSEAARVRFTIQRRITGRRVRGRCRPATRRNRGRPRCALHRRTGSLTSAAKAGRNRTRFSGRLRGRRLPRGRYRAIAVATDSAGGRSTPASVRFRIVRHR